MTIENHRKQRTKLIKNEEIIKMLEGVHYENRFTYVNVMTDRDDNTDLNVSCNHYMVARQLTKDEIIEIYKPCMVDGKIYIFNNDIRFNDFPLAHISPVRRITRMKRRGDITIIAMTLYSYERYNNLISPPITTDEISYVMIYDRVHVFPESHTPHLYAFLIIYGQHGEDLLPYRWQSLSQKDQDLVSEIIREYDYDIDTTCRSLEELTMLQLALLGGMDLPDALMYVRRSLDIPIEQYTMRQL
jgi:hypothetical protein